MSKVGWAGEDVGIRGLLRLVVVWHCALLLIHVPRILSADADAYVLDTRACGDRRSSDAKGWNDQMHRCSGSLGLRGLTRPEPPWCLLRLCPARSFVRGFVRARFPPSWRAEWTCSDPRYPRSHASPRTVYMIRTVWSSSSRAHGNGRYWMAMGHSGVCIASLIVR